MMKFLTKIKKLAAFIGITAAVFFTVNAAYSAIAIPDTAHAGVIEDLGKLFKVRDEDGLSFTQFEGEVAELDEDGFDSSLTSSNDIREFIIRIVNFALGFLGLFAVIVIIYGGVLYVGSGGNEENTQKGRKAILYAAIGLLIVLGSFAFVNTVISSTDPNQDGVNQDGFVVGSSASVGGSFNASASQVRSIAEDIYQGFLFLAESTEEIKNIMNDINKASLDYTQTLVDRSNALNFMFSVREKLLNMRSKVPQFSTSYVKINDFLRTVDNNIDELRSLSGVVNVANLDGEGGLVICGRDVDCICTTVTTEGLIGRPLGETTKIENGCIPTVQYLNGLNELWQGEIRPNFENNLDSPLPEILNAISQDYLEDLLNSMVELEEIRDSLRNIEAFIGEPERVFEDMIDLYGYSPLEDNPDPFDPNKEYGQPNSFIADIDNWRLSTDGRGNFIDAIDTAGGKLFQALETQIEFQQALLELQSVEARLRASAVTGSAPLVVTFDVLGTVDPAGGAILAENVIWDAIDGSQTLEGEELDLQDAVECDVQTNTQDTEELELFGPTFNQCTFNYPGTYVATVRIRSNDPSQYVDGTSTLIIRVSPPTTKINLDLSIGEETETVISYYDNGLIKTDRNVIAVTTEEARDIDFDASSTENVQNFRWDFGNGRIVENDQTGLQENVSFETEGKYPILLEVQNKLNQIDRKIFTLDVRNTAARIRITPDTLGFINDTFSFDAGLSAAASGTIRSFEWSIQREGADEELDLGNKANQKSFSHKFDQPGRYQVNLRVVNSLDNQPVQAETKTITVRSQPPNAIFDYEIPNLNRPAEVHFDASRSFDPDGSAENFSYEWTIDPPSERGANWEWVNTENNDGNINIKNPVILFKNKQDYEVNLKVTDNTTTGINEESGQADEIVEIDDLLDLDWDPNQEVTGVLDDQGETTINFTILSENGVAYEIDLGDDTVLSGDIINGQAAIPHTYREAGRFTVKATVFDSDDNDKSITRRVFISGGDTPIAKIGLSINGTEVLDLSEDIEISTSDILTLDASQSKNVDGTGRKLKYSWDFGDTNKSSNKTATHSYDELSPADVGSYFITLTIADKDDPTLTAQDEVQVEVVNREPTFSSIQAVPQSGEDLVTPVEVTVKAFGANDPDGEITQYRWWYFDEDDPDDPLGIQITTQPTARLVLGTNGREGDEITYGFGLEITDNHNLTVSSEDIFDDDQLPTVTVTNGPNELPTAKFNVSTSKVFTTDKVIFTSASQDPDGQIETYVWDLEGDGFFNNRPQDEPTLEHQYTEKNLEGYEVRLKVIDDKGGEAISDPVTIYVETLAEPPTAAFRYQIIEGSNNLKVKFINNSTADEEAGAQIIDYQWDFDTQSNLITADSDGDGQKDNDIDARFANPERLYRELENYQVKLTVFDNQGNSDEVINVVQLKPEETSTGTSTNVTTDISDDPTDGSGVDETIHGLDRGIRPNEVEPFNLLPILNSEPQADAAGVITLTGESGSVTFDFSDSIGQIVEYQIDKNIYYDTDQNGITEDDQDFKTVLPGRWTTSFEKAWGQIVVKLTVIDGNGNQRSVTREIKFN